MNVCLVDQHDRAGRLVGDRVVDLFLAGNGAGGIVRLQM